MEITRIGVLGLMAPLAFGQWASAGAREAQGAGAPQKPNIIYILMDDLGLGELGCYGQELIETPNIDSLAARGMRMTRHYSGSPVSAPARCTLLTGLHSGHAQIRANDEMASRGPVGDYAAVCADSALEGQAPLRAGTMTLPRMLQGAGYTTGCFGKWGLGAPGSQGEPLRQGFDAFYGFNCQRMAHNHYPPFLYDGSRRVPLGNNAVVDPHRQKIPDDSVRCPEAYERFNKGVYAHDAIYQALETFVDTCTRPMFLFWATPLPHVSLQAPQRWVDHYVAKFGDEEPHTTKGGYLPCRYPRATYAAMVSYFDEQVGRLMQLLRRKGIEENTVVIFASDNGPTFNGGSDSQFFRSAGPYRSDYGWGKCFLHEGGIRVPMIAVWPGHIAPGATSDLPSYFPDVMPTLADIAGIAAPDGLDGISMLPALLGEEEGAQPRHEYLYWEHPFARDSQRALIQGPWKLLVQGVGTTEESVALYNLDDDPAEARDLSQERPDMVERLQGLVREAHREP